jgi:hypothetical protein
MFDRMNTQDVYFIYKNRSRNYWLLFYADK